MKLYITKAYRNEYYVEARRPRFRPAYGDFDHGKKRELLKTEELRLLLGDGFKLPEIGNHIVSVDVKVEVRKSN